MGIASFLNDVTKALQEFGDSVTSELSGGVNNNIEETVHSSGRLGAINETHVESAVSTSDIIGQQSLRDTTEQVLISGVVEQVPAKISLKKDDL